MATNIPTTSNWQETNQRYLTGALAVARSALEQHISGGRDAGKKDQAARETLQETAAAMPTPAALETLGFKFGLSSFEKDLLTLCAGVELDSAFAALCAKAQGEPQRAYATFSLALSALPEAHWSAITPDAPLRRWRLIEVSAGNSLTLSPLRIDERVLHYLTGVPHLDNRLAGLVEPMRAAVALLPSQHKLAEQIVTAWSGSAHLPALPIVQLFGDEVAGKRAIAAAACNKLGLGLNVISAQLVPTNPSELEALVRLWEREAALSQSALLLDCDEADTADVARRNAVNRLITSALSPLIVSSRERRHILQRSTITFDVPRPTAGEQRALWRTTLGAASSELNGLLDALVSQFSLSAQAIHEISAEALARTRQLVISNQFSVISDQKATVSNELAEVLWQTCCTQARPRLDDLALRLMPSAAWDDLILPEPQRQTLREIAAHVRQRAKVYETWGFAEKGNRGLGISALFAGASGTGKTMAAEVLANELRLDLYRIDLSSVVSKYIGETEKNLRRVFDAAEGGGAILLFDEADALFGKRSEVKDSHDRYANIEISYLLQRMEAYRGLAILTTNMKNALDPAFMRRLRFVVPFPFPDANQRTEIWRRIFPANAPTEGIDLNKLAQLNVPGGNIRNIALNAAFLAADANEPVRMTHVMRAARSEYAKMEKSLTDGEVRGWV